MWSHEYRSPRTALSPLEPVISVGFRFGGISRLRDHFDVHTGATHESNWNKASHQEQTVFLSARGHFMLLRYWEFPHNGESDGGEEAICASLSLM